MLKARALNGPGYTLGFCKSALYDVTAGGMMGRGASLFSTQRNIQKLPRYTQLHDVLAMKAWFKPIFV
jgi:hypothetical protein